MTHENTLYTVVLDRREVDLIVNALNEFYKAERNAAENEKNNIKTFQAHYDRYTAAREQRNAFAGLIGRVFMGADA